MKDENFVKILMEIYDTSLYSPENDYIFDLMRLMNSTLQETTIKDLFEKFINTWEKDMSINVDLRQNALAYSVIIIKDKLDEESKARLLIDIIDCINQYVKTTINDRFKTLFEKYYLDFFSHNFSKLSSEI